MGTYIIRVYRRDEETPSRLAGVVEEVGEDKVNAFNFQTAEELIEIIAGKGKRDPKMRTKEVVRE